MIERKPGPTPDTTVAHVDYDGGRYLVRFNARDEAEEVSYRLRRNYTFYGWRSIWKEGDKLDAKSQAIIDLVFEDEAPMMSREA